MGGFMDIDTDPNKVLRKLGLHVIENYLESYYGLRIEDEFDKRSYNYTHIAEDFWHGDFNVEELLKALGPLGVDKIKAALNG